MDGRAAARARSRPRRSRTARTQRAAPEVERPRAPPRRPARAASASAAGSGRPPRSTTGRGTDSAAGDHLDRLAVEARRRWCAAPRAGARPRPGPLPRAAGVAAGRRAAAPAGCCRPPSRVAGWSRNQSRCWAKESGSGSAARGDRRAAGPRRRPPARAPPRSAAASAGDRRAARSRPRSGSSTPKRLAHPRDHLGGQQRVAARGRRSRRRLRPAPGPGPRARSRPASPRPGRAAPRAAVPAPAPPPAAAGERPAVDLAVGGQRQRLQRRTKADGHHVVRQPLARARSRSAADLRAVPAGAT